jgi:hypothetical protein
MIRLLLLRILGTLRFVRLYSIQYVRGVPMEKEIPPVLWLHLVHLHRRKVTLFRNGF